MSIQEKIKVQLFMFMKLPAAFFSGVRMSELSQEAAVVKIRHKWFNQNPFRSMYFACQAMAAEFSSGILLFSKIRNQQKSVSMLVLHMEASFLKKAVGTITFSCKEGDLIQSAIDKTIASGESESFTVQADGINESGEVVSVFRVTWSIRAKSKIT